ncbi:MAG TPA: hypothetical protein VJ783_24175 [Pirellulales bacterium]|nr:hypothetical protein [Pirellulales bacterium]
MPRPQFSLKTLLLLMAVVAAFLGGMQLEWQIMKRHELWRTVDPKPDTATGSIIIPLDAPLPDGYQEVQLRTQD